MGTPSKFLWRLGHNTARPDILAADEPQPVEPLLIRQPDGFLILAHLALKPDSRSLAYNQTARPGRAKRYLLQTRRQTRRVRLPAGRERARRRIWGLHCTGTWPSGRFTSP